MHAKFREDIMFDMISMTKAYQGCRVKELLKCEKFQIIYTHLKRVKYF